MHLSRRGSRTLGNSWRGRVRMEKKRKEKKRKRNASVRDGTRARSREVDKLEMWRGFDPQNNVRRVTAGRQRASQPYAYSRLLRNYVTKPNSELSARSTIPPPSVPLERADRVYVRVNAPADSRKSERRASALRRRRRVKDFHYWGKTRDDHDAHACTHRCTCLSRVYVCVCIG